MRLTRNIIITLLIIVLCSALAFASDSPVPEQAPLEVEVAPFSWVDLEQVEIMKVAQDIKAATATTYTTDDIYNLLYAALRGSSSSTTYSLPYIANRLNLIYDRADRINTALYSGNTPKLDNIYSILANNLELVAGSGGTQVYSIAELVGMCWSHLGTIASNTNSIYTVANNTDLTNRKLEYVFSAIEDTINIKWYDTGFVYNGTSLAVDTNFLNSITYSNTFSTCYTTVDSTRPALVRVAIPIQRTGYAYTLSSDYVLSNIYATTDYSTFTPITVPEYFIESTEEGIYIYLFDMQFFSNTHYYFKITTPSTTRFFTNGMTGVFYIPFDTLDYQIIRTAFASAKDSSTSLDQLSELVSIGSQLQTLAQSSQSGSVAAEALADYFVSPAKQSAEDNSQSVINDTLNNFTGTGDGAARQRHTQGMKDVSGSLQSGLNSGGSVSGATGVFNSGSDFWGWFTQQNSNYINNPYPAPVVSPTRGAGDEIVDFLTPNSNELQDLLRQGGDQR